MLAIKLFAFAPWIWMVFWCFVWAHSYFILYLIFMICPIQIWSAFIRLEMLPRRLWRCWSSMGLTKGVMMPSDRTRSVFGTLPARLQKFPKPPWTELLPDDCELWIDGGIIDSCGRLCPITEFGRNHDGKICIWSSGMLTIRILWVRVRASLFVILQCSYRDDSKSGFEFSADDLKGR